MLISWPDSDWPHYTSGLGDHLHPRRSSSGTRAPICHEYGHHWQQDFTETDGTDYCNSGDRCDDPGEDCRHCRWCEETAGDALREGFPDWISNAVTASWPSSYGFSAIFEYDWESVDVCGWNDLDQFDDPWQDRGQHRRLPAGPGRRQQRHRPERPARRRRRRDLVGAADPVHPGHLRPHHPGGAHRRLRTRYPESADVIWMAAANARFNGARQQAPSALTGLASLSHATSGDSPDGTVELVWNAASDATPASTATACASASPPA